MTGGATPIEVDGVLLQLASDGRTGVIRVANTSLAVIADSDWHGSPPEFSRGIFTNGGPADWGPAAAPCLAVIQASPRRVDGLPTRLFLDAVSRYQILRPDQVGNVELVADGSTFTPAG